MIYLFDVDGTLTPSRGKIDSEFGTWFLNFAQRNRVGLVTGSDRQKTLEQLGDDIFESVTYSFNCLGNEVYHYGTLVHKSNWRISDSLRLFLMQKLNDSVYDERYGNHIETRTGLCNFSIVGRNAQGDQRKRYYEWDLLSNERIKIATEINKKFDNISAQVGGETGIDIFEKGKDKSHVLEYFNFTRDDKFCFFGDRIDPNGNDYTLAKRILDFELGMCYNVGNWTDTRDILLKISNV